MTGLPTIRETLRRMGASLGDGHYHPYFDRDDDGHIDIRDFVRAVWHHHTLLERQIEAATLATLRYHGPGGLERAVEDGFRPFTPELRGHGIHWSRASGGEFSVDMPDGLNFDSSGALLAVYYLRQPGRLPTTDANPYGQFMVNPDDDHPPDPSFDTLAPADWHAHNNVWITGVGSTDPAAITFEQDLTLEEVAARWTHVGGRMYPHSDQWFSPKFWMLHGWFHIRNPNGTFAMTHPSVAPHAPGHMDSHHGHH